VFWIAGFEDWRWGSSCRVQGSGFRFLGSAFRISGLGFMSWNFDDQGLECRLQGSRFEV